jgi:hypothetical protein
MTSELTNLSMGKVFAAGVELRKLPQVEMPLKHTFTPGMYARQIFMPKGTLVISRIHKTEHPYVVTEGRARVWTEDNGVVDIKAPHFGVTKPGTCRVLYIVEDCTWTTFHATDETDPEKWVETFTDDPAQHALNADQVKQLTEEAVCP